MDGPRHRRRGGGDPVDELGDLAVRHGVGEPVAKLRQHMVFEHALDLAVRAQMRLAVEIGGEHRTDRPHGAL